MCQNPTSKIHLQRLLKYNGYIYVLKTLMNFDSSIKFVIYLLIYAILKYFFHVIMYSNYAMHHCANRILKPSSRKYSYHPHGRGVVWIFLENSSHNSSNLWVMIVLGWRTFSECQTLRDNFIINEIGEQNFLGGSLSWVA